MDNLKPFIEQLGCANATRDVRESVSQKTPTAMLWLWSNHNADRGENPVIGAERRLNVVPLRQVFGVVRVGGDVIVVRGQLRVAPRLLLLPGIGATAARSSAARRACAPSPSPS